MDQPIRLMTANLLADRADLAYLGYVLDVIDPDFVVTQELGHKAAELMASRFPYHHLRPQLDAKGRGIAGKHEARFGEIPMQWRLGMWASVEEGPRPWILANIHVRNPIAFPWWRSVRFRKHQLESLLTWADGQGEGQPVLLAGDMNSSPAWPFYRRLSERWVDLVAQSAEGSDVAPPPTWAWRPGWPRVLRIDHVFGTGFRAVASQMVPLRGSDHAAVVVDLVFDPGNHSVNGIDA
jgi:endonuclease/exonuclease/phosphatase (EEP) superfamily protein YafD